MRKRLIGVAAILVVFGFGFLFVNVVQPTAFRLAGEVSIRHRATRVSMRIVGITLGFGAALAGWLLYRTLTKIRVLRAYLAAALALPCILWICLTIALSPPSNTGTDDRRLIVEYVGDERAGALVYDMSRAIGLSFGIAAIGSVVVGLVKRIRSGRQT